MVEFMMFIVGFVIGFMSGLIINWFIYEIMSGCKCCSIEKHKQYEKGRVDCLTEMLKLTEEWKNNSGSFLDFQRALRQKIKEQNNDSSTIDM